MQEEREPKEGKGRNVEDSTRRITAEYNDIYMCENENFTMYPIILYANQNNLKIKKQRHKHRSVMW